MDTIAWLRQEILPEARRERLVNGLSPDIECFFAIIGGYNGDSEARLSTLFLEGHSSESMREVSSFTICSDDKKAEEAVRECIEAGLDDINIVDFHRPDAMLFIISWVR